MYRIFSGPKVKTALVLFGDDSALYSSATIKRFIKFFYTKDKPVSVIAAEKKQVSQIGGLKIDGQNNIRDILTRADILKINKKHHLVLCGAFCFKKDWLTKNLKKIKKNKHQKPVMGVKDIKQSKLMKFKDALTGTTKDDVYTSWTHILGFDAIPFDIMTQGARTAANAEYRQMNKIATGLQKILGINKF